MSGSCFRTPFGQLATVYNVALSKVMFVMRPRLAWGTCTRSSLSTPVLRVLELFSHSQEFRLETKDSCPSVFSRHLSAVRLFMCPLFWFVVSRCNPHLASAHTLRSALLRDGNSTFIYHIVSKNALKTLAKQHIDFV